MKSVVILLCCVILLVQSKKYSAVYSRDTHKWSIEDGDSGVAWAELDSSLNQTGWDTITVVTNPKYNDKEQAFAAGFVEAALTQDTIWQSWLNWCNGTTWQGITPQIDKFIKDNFQWVQDSSASPTEDFDYWQQVGLVLSQFEGMYVGYNQYAPADQKLTLGDFLIMELQSEVWDISAAVTNSKDPLPFSDLHCSSLVRLSPDGQQLFSSHVTWSGFTNMLRLWKHYNFGFSAKSNASPGVSFSGYPGYLPSGDDYFITSSNLVVMETTNSVMNMSLYQYVTTETVPYWIRVTVANRMANNGKQWADIFAMYNSGTYNNQWIIVDNKLFSPGKPLKAGTLWIAEQIPGYVIRDDKTDVLQSQGFWSSYNVPYFPFVYNISGYPAYYEKYGNAYSYSKCARAQIFARDAGKVANFDDMKNIMRYNQWQTDPLSLQDACRGISARCDLNPPWAANTLNNYSPFGGIDCKITDNTRSPRMESAAVNGPTWDSQSPFAWTNQWSNYPHYGHPQVFNFQFEKVQPNWN